jgi:hypothetical protein
MGDIFPGNARLQPGLVVTKAGLEPGAPKSAPRGWHSRGHMPHFDSHHVVQHVTSTSLTACRPVAWGA